MWIPIDFVSHLMQALFAYTLLLLSFENLRLRKPPSRGFATSVGCAPYNFRKEQLETLIILSVN